MTLVPWWQYGGAPPDKMTSGYSTIRNQKIIAEPVSSVFDKLTDELLIEILIRLPLKPANLCKCISTRFRSLISGSYFVNCYVKHQGHQSFGLFCQSEPYSRYYHLITGIDIVSGFPIFESPGGSLSFPDCSKQLEGNTFECLASNNGLVLCCAVRDRRICYFVCNMLTKQWIALPPPLTNVGTDYVGFLCNPQYSCNGDTETGSKTRFKVVLLEVVFNLQLKLEIFCSESRRWTKEYFKSSFSLSHELTFGRRYTCRSAVVCGNLLHWDVLSDCSIFTYNPYKGEGRTIKSPHVITETMHWDFEHCLGECCGRLRFSNFFDDDKSFRVWELKDYGNDGEWLLLHKVYVDEVKPVVETVDKIHQLQMLFPHPLKEDVVFFWCSSSKQIVEYNLKTKLLKLPCFFQDDKSKKILGSMIIPFVLPCWPTPTPLFQQHSLNS